MKNKLNGRDFITIGIFNAIGIVIYMAVAFAMATTVIGGFIASGVSFMVAATVLIILMAVKVKRRVYLPYQERFLVSLRCQEDIYLMQSLL